MPRSSRPLRLVLFGLFVATTSFGVSCRRRDATNQKKEPTASLAIASAPITTAPAIASARLGAEANALEPLRAEAPVESVTTTGDSNATLLVPIGITAARPLLAILMPFSATPRADCELLGTTVRTNHFVLCHPVDSSSMTNAPDEARQNRVESALLKLVDATLSKYPGYVASKQLALVGIGTAAPIVPAIVRRSPEHFTRVGLIEGGFGTWTNVDSAHFVQAGGKALLVVNSDESRRPQAMRVIATVKALGARVRLEPPFRTKDGEATAAKDSTTTGSTATPTPELLSWLMTTE